MSITLSKSSQELRDEFFKMKTRDDVAQLLELTTKELNFHLYILPPAKRYKVFTVLKRSNGTRQISAPISPIKLIQRKLKQVLESIYNPKPSTHGFTVKRTIVSNARLHKKRRYVLNIDLENFFPSIHFGRVRGMFMGNPYNLNNEVSTVLAQICCHDRVLPQGAPTSPIISNMICARLDAKLQQLAKEYQCTYSRYADDIPFSTNRSKFPSSLAHLSGIGQVEIGDQLSSVIEDNGFQVNPQKTRLQVRQQRQEVTGLTVNKYPNVQRRYVRQVRAMLYAWEKYQIDSTAQNYFDNHAKNKYSDPKAYRPPFQKIVLGKIEFIGMIKGRNNPVYLGLLRRFSRLAPKYVDVKRLMNLSLTKPVIYTEGKTDRKHIEAALRNLKGQGLFPNLHLEFSEYDREGADQLLQRLNFTKEQHIKHISPQIFIFDRDRLDITRKIKGNTDFTFWKNNVYSFTIPTPKHRVDVQRICIEFYYQDDDIILRDENGRRLFLSTEFDPVSGVHLLQRDLKCSNFNILQGEPKIIDTGVSDETGTNVALSKNNFADNILNRSNNFANVDFSGFRSLFERIQLIINEFDSEND